MGKKQRGVAPVVQADSAVADTVADVVTAPVEPVESGPVAPVVTLGEPGRGKKQCPGCQKYVGAPTRKCECGHEFTIAPRKTVDMGAMLKLALRVQGIPADELAVVLKHLDTVVECGGVDAFRTMVAAVAAAA